MSGESVYRLLQDQSVEGVGRVAVGAELGCHLIDIDACGHGEQKAEGPLIVVVERRFEEWDRYGIVDVANRLVLEGRTQMAVAAVDDPGNPLLRLRLQRAGIRSFVNLAEVRSTEGWRRLLTQRISMTATDVSRVERLLLRLGERADPGAALEWVRAQGMEAAFEAMSQDGTALSRRTLLRIRREVGRLGDIEVPLHQGWSSVNQPTGLPRWREVVAFVNQARGAF